MKHTIGLLALLTLAACNTSESSKSKSCTYNGEPVNCSALEARDEAQGSGRGLTLTAKVSAEVRLQNSSIEVLEHTYNNEKQTLNGKSYECESMTSAGDLFNYKISGDKLQLSKDGYTETYQRLEGEKNELSGTWRNVEKDSEGSTVLTLVFTEDSMEIIVNCIFNK